MRTTIRRATKRPLLLALLLALPACERGPAEVPEEVLAARREAVSRACLSAELARTAEENVQTLQATADRGGVAAPIARQAAAYAEAFLQHARLRELAYAQTDSAFNHARAAADSTRYAERAAAVAIALPEPETLEANVIADYERQMDALLADADHPCNWNLPE